MEDQSSRHFGHGKSVAQVERIRDIQAGKSFEKFKYITPNRMDVVKDKYVLEEFGDYKVVEHETGSYHVFQESRLFDQTSGVKQSTGCVQVYTVQTWNQLQKVKAFKAFSHVIILHDPTVKEEPKFVAPKAPEAGNSFAKDDLSPSTAPKGGNVDDLASIGLPVPTLEEASAQYKEIFGRKPNKTWTIDQVLEKIKEGKK